MRKFIMTVSAIALTLSATPAMADYDHDRYDRHERHEHYEHREHHNHNGALYGALLGTGLILGAVTLGQYHHDYGYTTYAPPAVYAPAPTYYYNQPTRYVPNYVAPPVAYPAEVPAYVDENSGAYCREYTRQVRIGGQIQESYGTACMQPDGSWKVQ